MCSDVFRALSRRRRLCLSRRRRRIRRRDDRRRGYPPRSVPTTSPGDARPRASRRHRAWRGTAHESMRQRRGRTRAAVPRARAARTRGRIPRTRPIGESTPTAGSGPGPGPGPGGFDSDPLGPGGLGPLGPDRPSRSGRGGVDRGDRWRTRRDTAGWGRPRGGDGGVHARDEGVHARVIRRAAISAASDATRGALGCGEGVAREGRGWRVRVRVRAESGEARRKARRPSGLGTLGIVGGRQLRLGRIEDQTHLARARRAVEGEDGRERVARKITRGARERMREEGGGAFRTDARLVGARRVVSFRGDAFGREAANNRRVGRRVVGRRTHERYRRDRVGCGVGAPVRARECRRAHPAPRRARAV